MTETNAQPQFCCKTFLFKPCKRNVIKITRPWSALSTLRPINVEKKRLHNPMTLCISHMSRRWAFLFVRLLDWCVMMVADECWECSVQTARHEFVAQSKMQGWKLLTNFYGQPQKHIYCNWRHFTLSCAKLKCIHVGLLFNFFYHRLHGSAELL